MLTVSLSIVIAGLLSTADASPADQAALLRKYEALYKTCETARRGAIAQLEHALRGLKSQPVSVDVQRQIAKIEDNLRTLKENRNPVVPTLAYPPEVGAIGRLPRLSCHVDQILSPQEMLARCFFQLRVATVRNFQARGETIVQPLTVFIRGNKIISRAQEGADLELLEVFEVTGKQAYSAADGRRQKALVLQEFDMPAFEAYFREQNRQK